MSIDLVTYIMCPIIMEHNVATDYITANLKIAMSYKSIPI